MERDYLAIERLMWSSDIDIRVIPKRKGQIPASTEQTFTSIKQMTSSTGQMTASIGQMIDSLEQVFASKGRKIDSDELKSSSCTRISHHQLHKNQTDLLKN